MKNIEEIYNDGEVVVSIFDLGLITVTMFPGHECLRLYEKHSNHLYDQKDIKGISRVEGFNPTQPRTWSEVEQEVNKWIKQIEFHGSIDEYIREEAILINRIVSGEYGPVE